MEGPGGSGNWKAAPLLLGLLLSFGWLLPAGAGGAATGKVVLRTVQPLYPDPDISSKSLLLVPAGAELQILIRLGMWLKVNYNGRLGWLQKSLADFNGTPVSERPGGDEVPAGVMGGLKPPSLKGRPPAGVGALARGRGQSPSEGSAMSQEKEPPNLALSFTPGQAQVKAEQALYPDPDPGGQPLASVPLQARVRLLLRVADWYKVDYQGVSGWLPGLALDLMNQ